MADGIDSAATSRRGAVAGAKRLGRRFAFVERFQPGIHGRDLPRQASADHSQRDLHAEEFEDEFYRFLLFYRDRSAPEVSNRPPLDALMVMGEGSRGTRRRDRKRDDRRRFAPLEAHDLGLQLPSRDFSFDSIAAPPAGDTLLVIFG
jgi:hypothetical protein